MFLVVLSNRRDVERRGREVLRWFFFFLDSLNLLRDDHRVVLAELLALHRLVVKGAAMGLIVAVLTAVKAAATALEAGETDALLAGVAAVGLLHRRRCIGGGRRIGDDGLETHRRAAGGDGSTGRALKSVLAGSLVDCSRGFEGCRDFLARVRFLGAGDRVELFDDGRRRDGRRRCWRLRARRLHGGRCDRNVHSGRETGGVLLALDVILVALGAEALVGR